MTAWLLLIWVGTMPVVVPGINSEKECERLAPLVGGDHQFKCIKYYRQGLI